MSNLPVAVLAGVSDYLGIQRGFCRLRQCCKEAQCLPAPIYNSEDQMRSELENSRKLLPPAEIVEEVAIRMMARGWVSLAVLSVLCRLESYNLGMKFLLSDTDQVMLRGMKKVGINVFKGLFNFGLDRCDLMILQVWKQVDSKSYQDAVGLRIYYYARDSDARLAFITTNLPVEDWCTHSSLKICAWADHEDFFDLLMGNDVPLDDGDFEEKRNLLWILANRDGSLRMFKRVVDAGIDLSRAGYWHVMDFMTCSDEMLESEDSFGKLKFLVDRGCDINHMVELNPEDPNEYSLLQRAIILNRPTIIKRLESLGAVAITRTITQRQNWY